VLALYLEADVHSAREEADFIDGQTEDFALSHAASRTYISHGSVVLRQCGPNGESLLCRPGPDARRDLLRRLDRGRAAWVTPQESIVYGRVEHRRDVLEDGPAVRR
jgi:hypothetical protein